MEDYRNSYIKKYDKILLYFVFYTLAFLFFIKTLPYTIPFVMAFVVAAIVAPLVKLIMRITKQKKGVTGLILANLLVFYGLIGTLITFLTVKLFNQTAMLATNTVTYINDNYESIAKWFQTQYEWIVSNLQNLDPAIVESGRQMLSSTLNSLKNVLVTVGSAIGTFTLNLIAQVPNLLLIIIFTIVCSYFFTRMLIKNPDFLYDYLPTSSSEENRLKVIIKEGKNMILRYSLSYLLIIMITGVISTVGYMILGVPYPLLWGIITAFLDLMPVLGVSAAYVPIGIYYLLSGNYFVPVGLGILWVIVAVGRNIWEPRIVSSSLDINPVITIMAIFIGLKIAGVVGMFYLMFMAVGFKVLQKVGVLDTFGDQEQL